MTASAGPSDIDTTTNVPADLLAFPSEVDGWSDPSPRDPPAELELPAFSCEQNAASGQVYRWGKTLRGAGAILVCVVALGMTAVVMLTLPAPSLSPEAPIGVTAPAPRFSSPEPTQPREAPGGVKTAASTASSQLPPIGAAVAPVRNRLAVATNRTAASVPLPLSSIPQQQQPAAEYRGSLVVSSSPEGARVFLNGVAVGATPIVLQDISVGSRALRIELDGHERWSAAVRVVASEATRVTVTLRPVHLK